jgi:phosphoribosylformylglycinamidine synthase subunit PurQ / glutaminase
LSAAYRQGQVIEVCVAHGEGNYVCDDDTMRRLKGEGLVAFTYCDAEGRAADAANPNGAVDAIAGIYSGRRNVLGMMPHPENLIDPLAGGTDGLGLFESLVRSGRIAA